MGGVQFYANNGKLPVDRGDAVMIQLVTSKERNLSRLWDSSGSKYPIITITGPRQSGKTTLAKAIFPDAEYVNLEIPDVREEALRDARGFMQRHKAPVIFDEIQNAPQIISYIQAASDEAGRNSMYILTGSHQPALQAAISQTLAGRTGILELLPLSIEELRASKIEKSRDGWMFDGFMPRLYNNGPEPTQLYADYFRTYVERDVRQLANLRNLRQFETFIRLLSGRVAQLLNIESLASDTGVSATTVKEWLSILEASYVIRLLRPYYRNFGKRFIKAPKIYFIETGLAAYLLGIRSAEQISSHPLVGSLFENMTVMEAFKQQLNRGEEGNFYFLRTNHGVEIDLAWEMNGKLDLCEIKSAYTFHDEMANNIRSIEKLLPNETGNKFIVYSGRKTTTADGIKVLPFDTPLSDNC